MGIEVIGQTFNRGKASTTLSGQGIGDAGDIFRINAAVSAVNIGFGLHARLPLTSHISMGGRAGVHFWHNYTDETVSVTNASGEVIEISEPIYINDRLYGGGKLDDNGVYGYGCVNLLYR